MIIYSATNQTNGKVYIGQTIRDLETRQTEHLRESQKGKGFAFHWAISKYGMDNFGWEVLRECNDIDSLNKLEEYYISIFDSMNSGYNMTSGGLNNLFSEESKQKMKNRPIVKGKDHWNYGKKASKKTRQKHSKASSGENNGMYGVHRFGKDNPNYGNKYSKEVREKIRQSKIGKKHTLETIKKIKKACSGKNHYNYGKTHSMETKEKMSISQKNRQERERKIREDLT